MMVVMWQRSSERRSALLGTALGPKRLRGARAAGLSSAVPLFGRALCVYLVVSYRATICVHAGERAKTGWPVRDGDTLRSR
jgi:hypothetical protein